MTVLMMEEEGQQQEQQERVIFGAETIPAIFEKVQNGEWSVEKGLRRLGRVYGTVRGCHTALSGCLEVVARVPGVPNTVQRSLQLLVGLASVPPQTTTGAAATTTKPLPLSREDSVTGFVCRWPNDEFAHWLARMALDLTRSAEQGARVVACSVLADLLDVCAVPGDPTKEALFPGADELLSAVLLRLQPRVIDRAAAVRMQAVRALRRLQATGDAPGDPVHGALLRALERDPAAAVRVTAVRAIAPTPLAVAALVARTRDVAPTVRTAALRRVVTVCTPSHIAPEHVRALTALLQHPPTPTDALTARRAIRRSWLCGRECAGNPLSFLSALAAQTLPDDLDAVLAETALSPDGSHCPYTLTFRCDGEGDAVVCRLTITDNEDGEQSQSSWTEEGTPLKPEMALLWRVACEHRWCRVPVLGELAPLLGAAVSAWKRTHAVAEQYCLQQVLRIVTVASGEDTAAGNKEAVETLLRRALPELADEPAVLEPAMDVLRQMLRDEDEWTRVVVEAVSDLVDPLDGDDDRGGENNNNTEEATRKLPEEKVCRRGLRVVAHYLKQTTRDLEDPMVGSFLRSVILPALAHTSPGVREDAVRALGLACVLSAAAATRFLPLLAHALAVDVVPVRRAALEVVLDVVVAHGARALRLRDTLTLDLFHRTALSAAERRDLLLLAAVRALDERALRDTAVEGLARTVYVGAVRCPLVLARLLVLRFDALAAPALRPTARAALDALFPAYAASPRFAARHRTVAARALAAAVQWGASFNASRARREPRHVALRDMAAYALRVLLPEPAARADALAALLALLLRRPKYIAPAAPLLPLFRDGCDGGSNSELQQQAAQLLAQHRALIPDADAITFLQELQCGHGAHGDDSKDDDDKEEQQQQQQQNPPPTKRACIE